MILKKSEDAVSPVIGVMLLLVVTIVIAAVVAVFASGVGTDAEPAPTAVIDIRDVSDGYTEYRTELSINRQNKDGYYRWNRGHWYNEGEWDYCYYEEETQVFARRHQGTGNIEAYGSNTELQSKLLISSLKDSYIPKNEVTLSCLNGGTLDLSKVSVKIYQNGAIISETPQGSFSGSLATGDTVKLPLTGLPLFGNTVEVIVLSGDHVIVSKELKVTRGEVYT